MLHRVRLAMLDELAEGNLRGKVEVDKTHIGGKAHNMHKDSKIGAQKKDRNVGVKSVVIGTLERGDKVRATVVPGRSGSPDARQRSGKRRTRNGDPCR